MIELILTIIVIAGALVVFLMFNRLAVAYKPAKRSQAEAFNDLLNYSAVIEDGIIINKNGSLMAGYLYRGEDIASSTDDQRNALSQYLNSAFTALGTGWMVHVDAVKRSCTNYSAKELSRFGDFLTESMDDERRRMFDQAGNFYDGVFCLTVTWYPPVLAHRKLVSMMFDDKSKKEQKDLTRDILSQFKRELTNFESNLSISLSLNRLRGATRVEEDGSVATTDHLLSWLQRCITGTQHPIRLPNSPIYLDAYLGGQEMWGGVIPKIGNKFLKVISIEGLPNESLPGMLGILAEQPCEYRWSSRFIFMDQHEALSMFNKFRKKWRQKVRGFIDQLFGTNRSAVNKDAQSMMEDAEDAMADIESGQLAYGLYTSVIVMMDENRDVLEQEATRMTRSINQLGFVARIETVNAMEAYFGSLPGDGFHNVRRPPISTMNFADMIPTSSIWVGAELNPCPFYRPNSPALMHCVTNGATPFRLNLHVDDLGHTLVFGPTGSGKSVLLATLCAQMRRYDNMTIFAFDKGNSLYPLCSGIKAATAGRSGLHFNVADDESKLVFAPMRFLESKEDRAWMGDWIETLATLNGVTVSSAQRNDIKTAIDSLHAAGGNTLSEFQTTVQDQEIRDAIKQYTADGAWGHLLDAREDGLQFSDFTVFEIESLMNLDTKYALPVLLYIFKRIEKSLKGQPAAIILDEAWIMLGHPTFRAKIREWLKVLRKANCLVLMATQSLSDAANSGILDVLVESTSTKIFLPNPNARDEDASALYRRLGLNDRQIEIIADAIPKRQYYYTATNGGRRIFELSLMPLMLGFVAASDKESLSVLKDMQRKNDDPAGWLPQWLQSRKVPIESWPEAVNKLQAI